MRGLQTDQGNRIQAAERRAAEAENMVRPPPPCPAHSFPDCVLIAYWCARTHSPHPRLWPYRLLDAKREMANERIKKETDSAAAARASAIARVERETTQVGAPIETPSCVGYVVSCE